MKKNVNRFYVYALLDPRKPGTYKYGEYEFDHEPFYVGKGKNRRCYDHTRGYYLKTATHKNHKIKKIIRSGQKVVVIKIREQMQEEKSFDLEKELIHVIGRHQLRNGPLTNMDEGGGGSSGNILSEESKIKIGQNSAKYWSGKKLPKESIEKMKQTKMNQDSKQKWKRRKYLATSPDGEEHLVSTGFQTFCDNHNLLREKNGNGCSKTKTSS